MTQTARMSRRWVLCLCALFGCGGDKRAARGDAGARPDSGSDADSDVDADSDSDSDLDAGADAGVPKDDGCPALYDQDILPTFEVEIADGDWAAMLAEHASGCGSPKPYRPLVSFRWGDDVVEGAMIRRKGNTCFSGRAPKMQFVISFNETDPDARFHGLRKIDLDGPWYDPTMLHERLALSYLRDLGLPAQCANNAQIFVNGELYGIYANLERIDREFLERAFGDEFADGNLYKSGIELRTNEEIGDVTRRDQFWATTDVPTLETLGEMDEWVLEWAADAMLPDSDGYWCCENNFHLYDHPTRGFLFVPSDLDYTWDSGNLFPLEWDPLRPPTYGIEREHFEAVLSDPDWYAAFIEAVRTARVGYDPDALIERLDRWAAQIADAVVDDPNRTFTVEDHLANLERFRDLIPARAAWIDEWLACFDDPPGAHDADLDGVSWCEDCGEIEETCNWVDDDCDGVLDLSADCCTDSYMGAEHFALCRWRRTRADAEAYCEGLGGTLGVPTDSLHQFAMSVFVWWLVWEDYWIGANDLDGDGTFTAADGSALDYTAWAAREGDGQCVVMDSGLGAGWNDRPCGEMHASLCRLP